MSGRGRKMGSISFLPMTASHMATLYWPEQDLVPGGIGMYGVISGLVQARIVEP